MLTVCACAYFFATPGEYAGLAFQRWLTNGAEHDPNERGALMGRFLAMLHSFMALQTGITWMEPMVFVFIKNFFNFFWILFFFFPDLTDFIYFTNSSNIISTF